MYWSRRLRLEVFRTDKLEVQRGGGQNVARGGRKEGGEGSTKKTRGKHCVCNGCMSAT